MGVSLQTPLQTAAPDAVPIPTGDDDEMPSLDYLGDVQGAPQAVPLRQPAELTAKRREQSVLLRIGYGRGLVTLLLLAAVILPFFPGIGIGDLPEDEFAPDSAALGVFEQVNAVRQGDHVLVATEYGPTGAAELDAATDAILRHILLRGGIPVVVSTNPVGLQHADNLLKGIQVRAAEAGNLIEMNRDTYVIRYLPAGVVGLRDLAQNTSEILRFNLEGNDLLGENLQALNVQSLDDFALMILIAERSEELRGWSEQIAPLTNVPIVAVTGFAAAPLSQPYTDVNSGQYQGMMIGYGSAYTYNQMLDHRYSAEAVIPVEPEETPTPTEIVPTSTPPPPTATGVPATDVPATDVPTDAPTDVPPDEPTEIVPTATDAPPTATNLPDVTATDMPPTATPSNTPTATRTPTTTPTPTPSTVEVAIVVAQERVNLREGPGTNFASVGSAIGGDTFLVIDENDDGTWINVRRADDSEVWIAAFLVRREERPPDEVELSQAKPMRVLFNPIPRNGIKIAQAETPVPTEEVSDNEATPEATDETAASLSLSTERGYIENFESDEQQVRRWQAMTFGIIAAAAIIFIGNLFYGLRGFLRQARERE